MFSIDWHQKFLDIVVYAGKNNLLLFNYLNFDLFFLVTNPWDFFYYIFLFLTPMFIISGYLAYRLAKDIERNEKAKRAKTHQNANIAKVRKHTKRE
jgi:hypothetical protein